MNLPACSVISPLTSSSISTRTYLAVENFIAKNNPKVISCIDFIFDGYKSSCFEKLLDFSDLILFLEQVTVSVDLISLLLAIF